MNTKHFVTVVMGLCLALSFVGCEWTRDYSGGWFFWLRGAARVLPSISLLSIGLLSGAFMPHSNRAFLVGLGLLIPTAIYAVHVILVGAEAIDLDFRDVTLSATQGVLSGFVGYWLGQDIKEIRWLLGRIAVVLALGAFFKLFVKITGLGNEFAILMPNWAANLVIIFAYCWYLNDFLTRAKFQFWTIIALGGCTVSILADFQKPIIFSTIVCTLILLFVASRASNLIRIVFRMSSLTCIGLVAFFIVDQISSRGISARMQETIEKRFLHADTNKTADSFLESITMASGGRFDIWEQVFERFVDKPLFGWGPGMKFESESRKTIQGEFAYHNVYFEILISVGLIGFLPYFLGILWWYRLMLKKTVVRQVGFALVPCTAYITGILAYDAVGSGGQFFTVNALLLFLMGATARIAEQALRNPQKAAKSVVRVSNSQSRAFEQPQLGYGLGQGKTT
jgi:hypothetical protein